MSFSTFKQYILRSKESKYGELAQRWAKGLFFVAVVGYLIYRLTDIGWGNVWNSLPTTPWFYVILLAMYAILPLVETYLYGRLWNTSFAPALPVFFQKRVYNADVMGYSGEIFLYWWAKKHTSISKADIARTIKDTTIVSAMTSTSLALVLLLCFFALGELPIVTNYVTGSFSTIASVVGLLAVAIVLVVALRRTIFSLSTPTLGWLGGLHTFRFLAQNTLHVLQWVVVMPYVSLGTWISLISLYIVIHQIPLLPSRDLVFVGAGVDLSSWLGISPAPVAGMLLVKSVIDKLLNVGIYLYSAAYIQQQPDVDAGENTDVPPGLPGSEKHAKSSSVESSLS